MEEILKTLAELAGLALETAVVVIVVAGGVRALTLLFTRVLTSRLDIASARLIWIDFATAILFALEFALGADIVQTAVAPTWDDIGHLAAIAAIRTGLGYFLGRDIKEFSPHREAESPE